MKTLKKVRFSFVDVSFFCIFTGLVSIKNLNTCVFIFASQYIYCLKSLVKTLKIVRFSFVSISFFFVSLQVWLEYLCHNFCLSINYCLKSLLKTKKRLDSFVNVSFYFFIYTCLVSIKISNICVLNFAYQYIQIWMQYIL